MRKIYFVIGMVIFLVVAGFITKAIIEKVTRDITEREIRRIAGDQAEKITPAEIERITQQKTEEITRSILGTSSTNSLQIVECNKTPATHQFSASSYYEGPLIDAHLHMPFTFDVPEALYAQADFSGATLEKDVPAASIICLFDKTNVKSALGFYVVPNLLKTQALVQIKQVNEQFAGRVVPFIMTSHVSTLNLQPSEVESVLTANPGIFKGFGELAFYKDAYKGVSPDDESLRPYYDVAEKYGLVVMMHPDNNQQAAVKKILQDYPDVTFLFHGPEIASSITGIITYPNAFYTLDTDLSDVPGEGQSGNLYDGKPKDQFISNFKRDYTKIQSLALKNWKTLIEGHPDKFLWGTDRAFAWHFDDDVGALLDESARAFIVQLDPAVQEKFAYKNAERLLNEAK
ncbi:MAG TPA: amidohydrolase family protein [Candidatus Nanoarchaeia archaeon]|nr:amidohydrolase family protein [Candidatus Nanoarchaeia archaeon]